VTALVADYLSLKAATRAELLLAAPKILQAYFAATTDYFIWKLATKAYGKGSRAASAAVGHEIPFLEDHILIWLSFSSS
jgi:phosphatidylinositol glycan class B